MKILSKSAFLLFLASLAFTTAALGHQNFGQKTQILGLGKQISKTEGLGIQVFGDSVPQNKSRYEFKRTGFLKPYKLYHGDTAINIAKGWQFKYSPEFKRQFDPYPLARRKMLESQTYHYVGIGGQVVFTLFAAISFVDSIKCGKKIKEGKVCNPRPSHDAVNTLSVAFVWYYGNLRSHKLRKQAVALLNQQR